VTIWVDADACPTEARDILIRAARLRGVQVRLVANRPMQEATHEKVDTILVSGGPDAADLRIAAEVASGDLVVTADVPLAAAVVDKGAVALDPRGHVYDAQTVGERLSMRDFLEDLRLAGEVTGGPRAYGPKDRQRFADALDRWLTARGDVG